MSLIACAECGKEISDRAVACPHCGAPVSKIETDPPSPQIPKPHLSTLDVAAKQKRGGCSTVILTVLGAFLVLALIGKIIEAFDSKSSGPVAPGSASQGWDPPRASPPSAPAATMTPEQVSAAEDLVKLGLVTKLDCSLNYAMVDPSLWNQLPYGNKEGGAALLAQYCARQKGTDTVWLDIKDGYTGKKIAKFSGTWGFSVE